MPLIIENLTILIQISFQRRFHLHTEFSLYYKSKMYVLLLLDDDNTFPQKQRLQSPENV